MDEFMTANLTQAIRDRVSATLLDLEQRDLLTRKAVQYATHYEASQVRRIFIGEQPLSLTGYVAILAADDEICAAAKAALSGAVHAGLRCDVSPVRCIAELDGKGLSGIGKMVVCAKTLNGIIRDRVVTQDELASYRIDAAQLRTELDEIDANLESHAARPGMRAVGA